MASSYAYDPHGTLISEQDITDNTLTALNPYRYAGGMYDRTTDCVKFGQRWYDPETGRFTQQDALETLADPTRANRYEYANSNPINYADPTGKYSFLEAVGDVAGAALTFGTGAVGAAAGFFLTGGNPAGAVVGGALGAGVGGCAANMIDETFSNAVNGTTASAGEQIAACGVGAVSAGFLG